MLYLPSSQPTNQPTSCRFEQVLVSVLREWMGRLCSQVPIQKGCLWWNNNIIEVTKDESFKGVELTDWGVKRRFRRPWRAFWTWLCTLPSLSYYGKSKCRWSGEWLNGWLQTAMGGWALYVGGGVRSSVTVAGENWPQVVMLQFCFASRILLLRPEGGWELRRWKWSKNIWIYFLFAFFCS